MPFMRAPNCATGPLGGKRYFSPTIVIVSSWRALTGLFVILLMASACAAPTSSSLPADAVRITGAVQFYNLEGGFWAIKGDDGQTYDPKDGVAGAFKKQNLR